MRVNSNALLARKMVVTRTFGAEAWNQIFRRLARVHPCLRSPLTASSQVPLVEFLAFHNELMDRLYGGDANSTYFELGEQSANWAFVDGPCKKFIEDREIGQLAKSFSQIWQAVIPGDSPTRCTRALRSQRKKRSRCPAARVAAETSRWGID